MFPAGTPDPEEETALLRQRFDQLVEQSLQGILIERDLTPLFANRAFLDMMEFDSLEDLLIFGSLKPLIAPEERDRLRAYATARRAGREVSPHYEFTALTRNGRRVTLQNTAQLVDWDDGPATQNMLLDVTEVQRATLALHESELRYRNLVEGSVQGIVVHRDYVPLFVNDACAHIFGYSGAAEMAGMKSLLPLLAPHERSRLRRRPPSEPERGGRGAVTEFEGRRADGGPVYLLCGSRRIIWEGAEAEQVTFIDISDRKQRERDLWEAQERYRLLSEQSPDAILVHDLNDIAYANPAAVRLLRARGPQHVLGRPLLDFVSPACRELAKERLRHLAEDGGALDFVEECLVAVDGTPLDVEVGAAAVEWHGRPSVQLVIRDIAERKRLEARLLRSNEDLQQFAYAISHDLQEPLRMITSYLQLIENRLGPALDAEGREFFGYVVDGGRRMSRMIADLLDYSRVDGRAAEALATVSADDALDLALANLAVPIEETGARIDRSALPPVYAFPDQLSRVFQNLIGNSLKFRHPDRLPVIEVGAHPAGEGERWELRVRDNGIGMASEGRERIFGVFQRLKGRPEVDGNGIGLAVVKRIVERHGGSVRVESEPEIGSTFIVTLPGPDLGNGDGT